MSTRGPVRGSRWDATAALTVIERGERQELQAGDDRRGAEDLLQEQRAEEDRRRPPRR